MSIHLPESVSSFAHDANARKSRGSFSDYAGQLRLATDVEIYKRKSQEAFNALSSTDVAEATRKGKKTKAKKENADDLKKEIEMTEHLDPVDVLLDRFKTDKKQGLSETDYKAALDRFGPNSMTPPKTTPEWLKFIKEITNYFALLLWAGGILCFISVGISNHESDLYLGIVLCVVVLITGVFSYCQQRQSGELMNSFKEMMADQCTVTRGGKVFMTPAQTLVPGDILSMKGGEKVPADVRIIECSDDMQVDNACLTGESEPCKRSLEAHHENPLEADNLAFFGTQIPKGTAVGLVVRTGDNTVMGRIAKLAVATETETTPIAREINHFIARVSAVAITLGIIFFIIGLILGNPWIQSLVFMIGIIVANVPEGLLATVTVCLTLTASRMYLENVLVKNLEGVETLGSTTCICSDKTGTLTQNIMTVTNVLYGCKIYDCECSLYDAATTVKSDKCFQSLTRCACLCNKAKWDDNSKIEKDATGLPVLRDGKEVPVPFSIEKTVGKILEKRINWRPIGDASESALIKYVQAYSENIPDIDLFRTGYPIIKEIPFNSTTKYQVSINQQPNKPNHLIVMKGAPERILNRCTTYYAADGSIQPVTPAIIKQIEDLQTELSKRGLRVLGFAEIELPCTPEEAKNANQKHEYTKDYNYDTGSPNFPLGEKEVPPGYGEECTTPLIFIGMTAMIDPPRPQVPGAVTKCKTAGIRIIMVTGDHPVTAKAIAKKVGILWSETEDEIVQENLKNGFYGENAKPRTAENGYREPSLADAIVVPGNLIGVDTPVEVWDDILNHTQVVFARTSPQQKLLIVENCQRREEIVAVTGDGVNDAPALRKADIGIAMGIMGSAVSKDAADMILLDDNFASIVQGVEEGRLIFDNLKKSITYTLASNIPELFPFLTYITVGIPLPLDTITILCIDLGADMVPAIAYAWETSESDIMRKPPRYAKEDRLVNLKVCFHAYAQTGVTCFFCAFFGYITILDDYGFPSFILPNAATNNHWGRQTLYCSFTGGEFKNIDGEVYPAMDTIIWGKGKDTVDAIHKAFQEEYWFYDSGRSFAHISDCAYPARNFASSDSKPAGYERYWNTTSYGYGQKHVTDTSIEALYERSMVEYIPFRSTQSQYWNQNWLHWNVENSAGEGLGVEKNGPIDSYVYTFQPFGVYKVQDEIQTNDNVISYRSSEKGIVFNEKPINPKKCFRNAILEQGNPEPGKYSFPHNTYRVKDDLERTSLRLNIASRMCQKEALAYAQSGYFISIIIVQTADLLMCRARMVSSYEQGMKNHVMNFGMIFQFWLCLMICYVPPFYTAFGTRPIRITHWCIAMPWFAIYVLADEGRKYLMRRHVVLYEDKATKQVFRDAGWVERNTYY